MLIVITLKQFYNWYAAELEPYNLEKIGELYDLDRNEWGKFNYIVYKIEKKDIKKLLNSSSIVKELGSLKFGYIKNKKTLTLYNSDFMETLEAEHYKQTQNSANLLLFSYKSNKVYKLEKIEF